MGEGILWRETKRRKRVRKREGEENQQFRPLSAFRRLEFIGLRVKVRPRDERYAPRGRDSSSFGYFHPKGCLTLFSALRGRLAEFSVCDKAALFDPTYCLDFGTGFMLGNKGNLDSCPS